MANLACVDQDDRIEEILPRYLAPISGPVMISAGIAIQGAAKIARCRKNLTARIVQAILQVEKHNLQDGGMPSYRDRSRHHCTGDDGDRGQAIAERAGVRAEGQTENPRPGTRKKAELFLKKNQEETPEKIARRRASALRADRR